MAEIRAAELRALREDAARAGVGDPIAVATDLLNASNGDVKVFTEQIAVRLLAGANPPPRTPNAWAHAADLDGDGGPEWLVSIPAYLWRAHPNDRMCYTERLPHGHHRCPGLLVLFARREGTFAPLLEPVIVTGPRVFAVEDLLGDGTPEVLLTSTDCGAHTCYTGLTVDQWDGRAWRNMGRMSQTWTEISLVDSTDGGPRQILLHGGGFSSAGAGPQRQHTLVNAYDPQAGQYQLVQKTPDPNPDNYLRVLDANAALAAGDLDGALTLATDVLVRPHTDRLFSYESYKRREDRIAAFAAIEAMLVHALRGQRESMEALAQAVAAKFDGADNAYVEAAQRLWETYQQTGDAVSACGEMAQVVRGRLNEAQFYGWYGYNQERLPVDRLCALGSAPPEGPGASRECARDEQCL